MTLTTPAPKKPKPKTTPEEVLVALMELPSVRKTIGDANIIREAVINVFENKWRINLWESMNNPIIPNAGRILKSYFVKFSDYGLEVIED